MQERASLTTLLVVVLYSCNSLLPAIVILQREPDQKENQKIDLQKTDFDILLFDDV